MDRKQSMTCQLYSNTIKIVKVVIDGIVEVWCALHQLDLVVQANYIKLYDN